MLGDPALRAQGFQVERIRVLRDERGVLDFSVDHCRGVDHIYVRREHGKVVETIERHVP